MNDEGLEVFEIISTECLSGWAMVGAGGGYAWVSGDSVFYVEDYRHPENVKKYAAANQADGP